MKELFAPFGTLEQVRSKITHQSTCKIYIAVSKEKTFTDEQKEIFEKFHDCWDEYVSLAEAAIFEYAFRLGARLAMETLQDNE
ncbi:MAG: hypothetical protein IJW70_10790 [Clostridia bacterium]|nr:hypothetical protein [Clostridia bacterium]